MKLRKLEYKDAPFMLEWMQDLSSVKYLQTDFTMKTIRDCEEFIKAAQCEEKNLHLAIVDESDLYMGTVSLKNINGTTAEFAIIVRTVARGKGYSKYGIAEIIRIGKEELGLQNVFWYVSPENKRALRFYDKNGYHRIKIDDGTKLQGYNKEQVSSYIWYSA